MIPNLKSKLKQMSSPSKAAGTKPEKAGEDLCTRKHEETCFMKHIEFPLSFVWGHMNFSDFQKIDREIVEQVSRIPYEKHFDMHKILFLDTETTGLSGGAGTLAFLVGAGYFEHGKFILNQYLMRDFSEEVFLLQKIGDLSKRFDILVTFNGKSFDYPLLESRYIMNRLRQYCKEWYHVDLLYPSRRLWKRRIEHCSLKSLEVNILNFEREDDITGFQIPEIYFDYLKTKDFSLMEPILKHNEWDILSMVSLMIQISTSFMDPMKCNHYLDLYSLGKVFESERNFELAEVCYQRAVSLRTSGRVKLSLSMLYKKRQNTREAVKAWREMIDAGQGGLLPYIELAKYFEHREKDYYEALRFTKMGIAYLMERGLTIFTDSEMEQLNKRRRRLEMRIQKREGKSCP